MFSLPHDSTTDCPILCKDENKNHSTDGRTTP
jgi:hypothetical protein